MARQRPPARSESWGPDRVFGFDLGSSGALAIADARPGGPIVTERLQLLPAKKYTTQERLVAWSATVKERLDEHRPLMVGYEDAQYIGARPGSQDWLRRQEAILLLFCAEREILIVPIGSTSWQSVMRARFGKWPKGKGQVKLKAQQTAAAQGWIPNEWVGAKPRQGEADAAWVADYARRIELVVAPQQDLEF